MKMYINIFEFIVYEQADKKRLISLSDEEHQIISFNLIFGVQHNFTLEQHLKTFANIILNWQFITKEQY